MGLKKKTEISDTNRQKLQELQSNAAQEYSMSQAFSKERILTYLAVIFLPPLGIWRIWRRESTFRRAEKYVWTGITAAYLFSFVRLLLPV